MAGHDVPTVHVSVEVVQDRRDGERVWLPCPWFTNMPEFVYCRDELSKLLDSYGTFIASYGMARRLCEYPNVERFRILVRGAFTKRQTAIWEWHWVGRSAQVGMFVPNGEPLVSWPRYEDVQPEVRDAALSIIHLDDAPPEHQPKGWRTCRNCSRYRQCRQAVA